MNHGTYATEDRFVKMKFIWGCPKGHVCVFVWGRERESPGSLLQVAPNNYGNGEELTKMIHFSKTIRILCVEPVVLHLLSSPLLPSLSPLLVSHLCADTRYCWPISSCVSNHHHFSNNNITAYSCPPPCPSTGAAQPLQLPFFRQFHQEFPFHTQQFLERREKIPRVWHHHHLQQQVEH